MKRLITITGIVCVIASAMLGYFYWRYERYSLTLIYKEHVYYETANAIKHATAAADMYLALSPIIGEKSAEHAVVLLGKTSEYVERTLRSENLDTPAELHKDMVNNRVGITAAQWHQRHQPNGDVRTTIKHLADKNGLIGSEGASKVPAALAKDEGYKSIHDIFNYVESERENIVLRTQALLDADAP